MIHAYGTLKETSILPQRMIINNSADKLRHPKSVAYSAEQVLLNKQQIWCGRACLHC